METRNLRKTRQGVVTSNKMDKTIVIAAKFITMVLSILLLITTPCLTFLKFLVSISTTVIY